LTDLGLMAPPKDGPAILVWDIETAPGLGWAWEKWNTNVIAWDSDWYMLSVAYKWLGQKKIEFIGLNQSPDFQQGQCPSCATPDDRFVVERTHFLLDAADVAVAHNGDRFDIRKVNARFLAHDLGPVSPFSSIDTLKEHRRYFKEPQHSLSEIGRQLGIGEKEVHTGFDLWRRCMDGDPSAWRDMKKYNVRDVQLLEDAYLKIRPWIGTPGKAAHPNVGHWEPGTAYVCPKCGHDRVHRRGTHRTSFSEFQVFHCQGCGGYTRERIRKSQKYDKVGLV